MHAEAVEAFLAANGMIAARGRGGRLSRPDRAAPAGSRPHRPARRRAGAGRPARHSGGLRIPRRRRRGRRAGGAGGAGVPSRAGADARARASGRRAQCRRRRQRDLHRRRRPTGRLRYRPRQCADRRLSAPADRRACGTTKAAPPPPARSTRPRSRACSTHPFFAKPPPKSLDRNTFRHWVAEEGGLADKSTEDGAATHHRHHRGFRRSRRSPCCRVAPASWIVAGGGTRNPTLMRMLARARSRRRRSRPPARSAGRPTRSRRRPSPIWRCARSRNADHVPDHDRRAAADDRRRAGEAGRQMTRPQDG